MGTGEVAWQEVVARLPVLLNDLLRAEPHALRDLTKARVKHHLREHGGHAGVYVFSEISSNKPVYVGRSANLPQRIGSDHRWLDPICATVTKRLKDKMGLASMEEAREHLFDHYHVRFIVEPDVHTRAIFEIYASMVLGTEFNSFVEH